VGWILQFLGTPLPITEREDSRVENTRKQISGFAEFLDTVENVLVVILVR
jgi:hypothetical protein